jgi:hypothetical protein
VLAERAAARAAEPEAGDEPAPALATALNN